MGHISLGILTFSDMNPDMQWVCKHCGGKAKCSDGLMCQEADGHRGCIDIDTKIWMRCDNCKRPIHIDCVSNYAGKTQRDIDALPKYECCFTRAQYLMGVKINKRTGNPVLR